MRARDRDEDVQRVHFIEGRSMLVDCVLARDLPIDVDPRRFCHAGPPLGDEPAPPPLAGAAVAGLIFEGQAATPDDARALIGAGRVQFTDNHGQGGVGALAGLVTPRMPVFVVEHSSGRRTYAPISDSGSASIRFGMYATPVLENLRWCSAVLQPMLSRLLIREPVDVARLLAKGLLLGDEGHNRCDGSSMELLRLMAPGLAEHAPSGADLARAVSAIATNAQFSLPIGMAAAKGLADDLHDHGPAGVITAASGNGRTFGIRVSGAGEGWFKGDAYPSTFTALGQHTAEDMNPILGDSAIMEITGLGSQALTAAPALIRRFGLSADQVASIVDGAEQTSLSRSPELLNPANGFAGTPVGISARRLLERGEGLRFTMGYLSRAEDGGRVGMGIGVAAVSMLESAVSRLVGDSDSELTIDGAAPPGLP